MFRKALQKKQPFGVSQTTTIVAPINGLRSDKGLAMEQTGAALLLTNWVAETDAIRVRRGTATHLTGSSTPVDSLMVYTSGTASKLFAASDEEIYDATTAGPIGAAVVTNTGNAYFSYANFTTAAGTHYIVLANGETDVLEYDGSTWTEPTITGATSADLIYVWVHKQRLWFIEKTSMSAWYLATDAISGAATEFPLGGIFSRGGRLVAGGTLSYDSGRGLDDFIVFVTSEGEVAIYSFSDPSDPSTLLLKGVYFIGRPIGRRCLFNVGGDLLILTYGGVIPLSKAVQLDQSVLDAAAMSAPIRREFADAAIEYGENQGWEISAFPSTNILIVNVPELEYTQSRQYVANLLSTAWSKWQGITALCWAVFNDRLYYGGVDGVYQAETGSSDNGVPISAQVIPAFTQLGARGVQKHVMEWRPIIKSNAQARGGVSTVVDYADATSVPNQTFDVDIGAALWDEAEWDVDVWFGGTVSREWRSGTNIGTAVAPHYALTVVPSDSSENLEFRLLGFDCIYKVGNPL